MTEKWNERLDCEESPFEQILHDMQRAMPQYAEEIQHFGNRYTEFVLGEVKGMPALLVRLKSEGYKLYGLTNWCSKVHATMKQYPIFQLLDGRAISSEEHLVKPSVAIYERLCHKFELKEDECVFADDKIENIEAALNLEWKVSVSKMQCNMRKILGTLYVAKAVAGMHPTL